MNIGSAQDKRVKDPASLVQETVGFEGGIRHDLSQQNGMPRKPLDVTFVNRLGWLAQTDLGEGIGKTYARYVNRLNK